MNKIKKIFLESMVPKKVLLNTICKNQLFHNLVSIKTWLSYEFAFSVFNPFNTMNLVIAIRNIDTIAACLVKLN